jgi:LmbE family N-acetylglucosaminyl deacetylase
MKVEQMGFDLNKLAADTLADIPETRIAANFHVPPSVAGLNVGVKRSDYGDAAARKAFTEQTLMSLWRLFASELLNGLKDEYPGTAANFVLQFDLRRVGALQEELSKRWERVTLAFNRSLLTRAEAKQELGMQPGAGDDVFFVSLASEFVPAGGSGVVERTAEVQKQLTTKGTKGHEGKARTGAQALQRIRLDVARRMTQAVDVYFSQLADRVVERAGKNAEGREQKADLPNAGDLLSSEDRKKLEALVKRFYVEVLTLSWDQWNYVLGVEKAFDLEDPLVGRLLKLAAQNVKEINDTTMQEIRDALKYGNANGWSVDQLVRGDENQPGLRTIVDETYKGRARTIARTELGEAQNSATVSRYKEAGVKLVEILDGGSTDDDEECQIANGQIWTVDYFNSNRLEHPNCTRAAAPVFDDVKPDRG